MPIFRFCFILCDMKVYLIQIREEEKELEFERSSFLRSAGLSEDELISVDFLKNGIDAETFYADAIIIGGSKYGVAKNDPGKFVPNLGKLINFVNLAINKDIPFLGVCFGHQLLAYVYGGEVIHEPRKEERGTYVMELTKEAKNDSLFGNLPKKFNAQCAHHDYVFNLPSEAIILAKSELCAVEAFRMGEKIYGAQFHPERSKEDYEAIIKWRFKDHGSPLWATGLLSSPEAESIIKKFVDHFGRNKV